MQRDAGLAVPHGTCGVGNEHSNSVRAQEGPLLGHESLTVAPGVTVREVSVYLNNAGDGSGKRCGALC